MANALKDKYDDLNPGDVHARDTFENNGQHDKNDGLSDAQRQAETDSLNDAYQAPSASDPTWDSSKFTGAGNKAKIKGKKGPIGALIGIVIAGGIGVGGLFAGPSLLLEHIYATALDKYNASQDTAMTLRTNRMLANKFAGKATKGVCTSFATILCRYERPSNRLIGKMEKAGYKVYAADGSSAKTAGIFPNKTPAYLTFTGADGQLVKFTDAAGNVSEKIPAKELSKFLTNYPEARAAMRQAYNPRFVSMADSVFSSIKKRFGFNGKDKLSAETDPTKVNEDISDSSKAATSIADEGTEALDDLVTKEVTDDANKVAKSGRGNAIGLLAGVGCLASDIPSVIVRTARTYQMAQYIRYAAIFLTTAAAIRAGDATPTETSALGKILTDTNADGQSGMDSFGMRNLLNGDTNTGSDTNWRNYIAGASVLAAIGGVALVTSSTGVKDACRVATSPVTGAAIDLAASETVVVPIANFVVGSALSVALPLLLSNVIPLVVAALPMQELLKYFLGDMTKGAVNMAATDIFASGAPNIFGQTFNAAGGQPQTINQKIAYDGATSQVQLAQAEEDRATLSPLDASNPNTALGSFVNQFMPYYADMTSVSGVFTMIGSIASGSVSSLITPAITSAADPSAQYEMCDDPAITSSGTGGDQIAAGPFCDIQYGIPVEYLNEDPETVLQNLIDKKQVNETTGDPIPDSDDPGSQLVNLTVGADPTDTSTLSSWLALCTDGSTDQAKNCEIKDQTTAEYALYSIDHRIQKTMDGEDAVLDGTTSTATNTTTSAAADTTKSQLLSLLDSFNTVQPQAAIIPATDETSPQPFVAITANPSKFFSAPAVKRYGNSLV